MNPDPNSNPNPNPNRNNPNNLLDAIILLDKTFGSGENSVSTETKRIIWANIWTLHREQLVYLV